MGDYMAWREEEGERERETEMMSEAAFTFL